MTFEMSEQALEQVKSTHPDQVWFFAMSGREKTAVVLAAFVSMDMAKRTAKLIGSIVRVGRVVNGKAETL